MVFDDDAKLIGLYNRYLEEVDEMKANIIQYIDSETFKPEEEEQAQELNQVRVQSKPHTALVVFSS